MQRPIRSVTSVLVLGGILLSGCVSRRAYDELSFAKKQEESARIAAQEELRELERKLAEPKPESEAGLKEKQALEDKVARLEAQVAQLQKENLELVDKGAAAGGKPQVTFDFPEAVRRELKVEVNPATGGLIFEHDVLFTGSGIELKPGARAMLEILARALETQDLRNRRVFIDGHTDSRPITLTRDVNPDNWVLGARRAAACLEVLAASGVENSRLAVRSFAATKPLIAEHPEAPRNRRVEFVLGELLR
jgi:chemotaxis protein MotB